MSRKWLVFCALALAIQSVMRNSVYAGTVHLHSAPDVIHPDAEHGLSYYDPLVNRYDSDPHAFDLNHPLLGHLLSDPKLADKWLELWEEDEKRFEHRHPILWDALEKYLLMEDAMRLSTDQPTISDPFVSGFDPKSPPDPSPFDDPSPLVPEPESLTLLLTALVAIALAWSLRPPFTDLPWLRHSR